MKQRFALAACAALLGGCLPEKEQQMIVVDGEGVVMATPDTFEIRATLYASGKDPAEATASIGRQISNVSGKLPTLEGLSAIEIGSANVSLAPIYDVQCLKTSEYSQRNACPVVGRSGNVRLSISGKPAEIAGNAASLLSELGAAEVEIQGFTLSDLSTKRSDATAAALADAQSKAKRLAQAMGVGLGEPLRVQYGEGLRDNFRYDEESRSYALAAPAPALSADRIAPEVALTVSVQPFEVREKVTAAFAIETAKP